MSGIVGILHLDGSPVDHELLQRLADFQSFRGPDAKSIWTNGNVGLGHTLLRTTEESERERQPFHLGDDLSIVADARVDGQESLIAELQAAGQAATRGIPDAELILHAYRAWGEDCVKHLLGDFSFAIWDGARRKLFCARDQMGVKCFYYAHLGSLVIFSNSLGCLRRHPSVSGRLNDLAIADFLLFERNLDQATTSFADIRRLPPAHRAEWSPEGFQKSVYWIPPIEEPVFYKRAEDYIDRFMELLTEAVSDRLRSPRVGILMSGGLDSPALAATACDISQKQSLRLDLRAFTTIVPYGPDEGYYAGLVAERLGISIEFRGGTEESIRPNWELVPFRTAEPVGNTAVLPIHPTSWDQIGTQCRVFLQGEGPDNAFSVEWRPYVSYLVRRKLFGRLFLDSCSYFATHRRIPFWGKISRAFRRTEFSQQKGPSFPGWINEGLESRFDLRQRWKNYYSPPPVVHPVRPLNYALLHIPGEFQEMFRFHDAESTQAPVEVRYPFMDLRLLRYLLTVPPIPWCRGKHLLRQAMKDMLPKPVLARPKEGLDTEELMRRVIASLSVFSEPSPKLRAYVDFERIREIACDDIWTAGSIMLARLLNHWLQYSN